MTTLKKKSGWIVGFIIVLALGIFFILRLGQDRTGLPEQSKDLPVPVEVVAVQHGPLLLHRTFNATIESQALFTVAPKISGRIQKLHVNVSDKVKRGQSVAKLEDDEYKQAVAEVEANLAVSEANLFEAKSSLEIAKRQLERAKTLHKQGIASDSDLDTVQAEFLSSQAAVKVASAGRKRSEAALAAAQIRLGYTDIKADWEQGDDERTVAERYVDEGDTVAANTPLFSIVELDPVLAVIQVTEKDYPNLDIGQAATLLIDAFPEKKFSGSIVRIAPVFRESSRQARIELTVPNPEHLLKPGMFARCILVLDRVEDAVSVHEMAITRRQNQTGVFLVSEDDDSVRWVEVKPGFMDGNQIQLIDAEISGRVVTLGQQLIRDGSAIVIPADTNSSEGGEVSR